MHASTFHTPDDDILEDYALGHTDWTTPLDAQACPGKAAGGLITTAGDYGQFVASIMNHGSHDGRQILEPLSVARMLSPVILERENTTCVSNNQCDTARGWFCDVPASTQPHTSLFQRSGQCARAPHDLSVTDRSAYRRYGLGVNLSSGSTAGRGTDANGWPEAFSHGGTQQGYRSYFYASGSSNRDLGLVILTNGTCQTWRNGVCTRGANALVDELVASFRRTYGW
jgi:CubicO group peptidase (beta-lactamase class C family)